jgi:hypothetical protein
MYRSLAGVAAAVILAVVAAPTAPANAAAIRHASGIPEQQSNANTVQYRRHWGGYGPRYRYGGYPGYYRYGGYPRYGYGYGYPRYRYPYAYAPYPYYRRYHRPRPFIGIGPVGIGVW